MSSENISINNATTSPKKKGIDYKWIALSNVIIATLMGTINGSIIMIALPAIFNGIKLNLMAPNSFQYLLWILMGYGVVTATLLLSLPAGCLTCTAGSGSVHGWAS